MKAGQHVPYRWPEGRPRTAQSSESDFSGDLTLTKAIRALVDELECKRWATGVIVAAGHGTARMTGLDDHGAAVYFTRTNHPYVFACDRFDRVQHNVWALYLHAKAKRAEDRYGICSAEEALAGYAQLPPSPDAAPYVPPTPPPQTWREWLGFAAHLRPNVGRIKQVHLELAKKWHPDVGGAVDYMAGINNARDEAISDAVRGGW